jgi:hypothetical protein
MAPFISRPALSLGLILQTSTAFQASPLFTRSAAALTSPLIAAPTTLATTTNNSYNKNPRSKNSMRRMIGSIIDLLSGGD